MSVSHKTEPASSAQVAHSFSTEARWIVFRVGPHVVRLPFNDDPADDGWQYVLDVTMMGFRADRVGDAVVITGRPSDCGGLAS